MKKIIIAATLLLSLNAFSQMRGQGISQRIQQPTTQPTPDPEKEKENLEKMKQENLEKLMEKLTPELNLDALQAIAIKQIYSENMKKQGIIMKMEISEDEKMAFFKSLSESTELKVLELLNPEQKQKFEVFKNESLTDQKKSKKTKKKTK